MIKNITNVSANRSTYLLFSYQIEIERSNWTTHDRRREQKSL